jgi:hypothetical protein
VNFSFGSEPRSMRAESLPPGHTSLCGEHLNAGSKERDRVAAVSWCLDAPFAVPVVFMALGAVVAAPFIAFSTAFSALAPALAASLTAFAAAFAALAAQPLLSSPLSL